MVPTVLTLLFLGLSGWIESSRHRLLFTPPRAPDGAFRTFVTARPLDEVIRAWPGAPEPRAVVAAEAFGQSGGYNRWTLARLYGGTRARVVRMPRVEGGQVVEAWTLVSPYPDPDLTRLEPGTLLIVLRVR